MAILLKRQNITNMYTPIELVTTNLFHHGGGGGVTDHGYLNGLGDNDHPQYMQTSVSSLLSSNLSNYQLTANNSLSLGTGASVSFVHTSNSSLLLAKSQSVLFALTNHTHTGLGGAASDHSHGSVNTVVTVGSNINIVSASSGLTVGVPNYLTTAYGAALQGSGTYSQNTGTIQFVNSHGVTFGLSDNGVMTASIPAIGGAQTGISGIAGSGASTVTEGTVQFANANGISFGLNSNTMTAIYTVPGATVFSNSNNVEFGLNGSTITALANLAQSTQTQNLHNVTLAGNTSGTMTQVSSGTLTLAGGNNITLSQSGNAITIIGSAGVSNSHNLTFAGNTSGTLAQVSSGTLTLVGGNNITLSQVGNAVTISGANLGGAQTGISGIGASNTTYTSGTVIWSGQNNVTIGSFVTGGSQYVRLSVGNYITTAAEVTHTHGSNISFGNTTNATESVVRASSSSNGLTMVIPKFLTTAALSQNTSNYAGLSTGLQSTSNTDVKFTLNTAGLNIAMPKFITTAQMESHTHGSNVSLSLTNLSGAASSASNGLTLSMTGYPASSFVNSSETGNVYFVGEPTGSNITWGSSSSSNSTFIYATAGGGEGGAGDGGIKLEISGNTAGATTLLTNGTVRLVGGNNITLSQAGSIITILGVSAPAANWLVTRSAGSAISIATGATNTLYYGSFLTTTPIGTSFSTTATNGSVIMGVINSDGIRLSVPPYITAGGGAISFSAGVSSRTLNSLVFSNLNGISFGLNGSTVTGAYTVPSGQVQFFDGGDLTWGTSIGSSSNITNIAATVKAASIFFSDIPNFSFGSSVNGASTTIYLITA